MLSLLTKIRGLTVHANMERLERRRGQRDKGLEQLNFWCSFKMPAAVFEQQGAATAGPSLAANGLASPTPAASVTSKSFSQTGDVMSHRIQTWYMLQPDSTAESDTPAQ